MFDFKQLVIWQRSIALSAEVRRATLGRKNDGLSELRSQLTRACRAVPANIAEGAGQATPQQTARFLDIALGSLSECESHLAEARYAEMLPARQCDAFTTEVCELRRMTVAFKRWVLQKQ